jgi:hypothetical protein
LTSSLKKGLLLGVPPKTNGYIIAVKLKHVFSIMFSEYIKIFA